MAVYSELLVAGHYFGTSQVVVYTAPAVGTVVVRDVVLAPDTDGVGTIGLSVLSGGVVTAIYRINVADSVPSYHWSGRQVLLPGDQLVMRGGDFAEWQYRVTGYVLGG